MLKDSVEQLIMTETMHYKERREFLSEMIDGEI
jgi:hypothetical protein